MRGTWSLTRCPAPARTEGGVLRCVRTRTACSTPGHNRYHSWTPLLAVLWWLRPWWPNALGRAQDRGEACTPNVRPCRAPRHDPGCASWCAPSPILYGLTSWDDPPCGHRPIVPGCGGCDPGAIEYVIEDGTRTLRPYDPIRDQETP